MRVNVNNTPESVFDYHCTVKCPHCRVVSNLSAIGIPRFELLKRFRPQRIGISYRCDSCNEPVFLRFRVRDYGNVSGSIPHIDILNEFEEVERPSETYELQYLPQAVRDDFAEALKCYSASCFNAFAAMCRRSVQSASSELGIEGTAKVQSQLQDLKATGVIDESVFNQLKEVMLAGHDGAHPHLPSLNPDRAAVLLELMKDVLYQLFVRQAKIRESMELRKQAISASRGEP